MLFLPCVNEFIQNDLDDFQMTSARFSLNSCHLSQHFSVFFGKRKHMDEL